MNKRNLRSAWLAAVALAWTGAALAGSVEADGPSVSVKYGDLNLQTRAGAAVLHRRLTAAARSVCPDIHERGLRAAAVARACVEQTIDRAVAAIGQPQLAQLHASLKVRG
jgi:UrcA family protein